MGGAIGTAIGILYGSSPPRGLTLFLAIGCILIGLIRCYQAYSVMYDPRPFHIRDLFTTIFSKRRKPTKRQLWIEGFLGIALGILCFRIFR